MQINSLSPILHAFDNSEEYSFLVKIGLLVYIADNCHLQQSNIHFHLEARKCIGDVKIF